MQLADEKITIFLDKLQRLDVQLARLRSQEEKEESGTNRELQEEEMINEEERETRAKKSSTRGRPKPQKSRATPSKARKPKSRQTPTVRTNISTLKLTNCCMHTTNTQMICCHLLNSPCSRRNERAPQTRETKINPGSQRPK